MDEYRKRINEQVAQKRHETNLLWQKRHDLQAEEQKLKEQIRGHSSRFQLECNILFERLELMSHP